MDTRQLQKLTGSYALPNLIVSILTSVRTKVSAQKSLPVRILMEATPVNVTLASEVIFAKTLVNVTKPVLAMQMHHV